MNNVKHTEPNVIVLFFSPNININNILISVEGSDNQNYIFLWSESIQAFRRDVSMKAPAIGWIM